MLGLSGTLKVSDTFLANCNSTKAIAKSNAILQINFKLRIEADDQVLPTEYVYYFA